MALKSIESLKKKYMSLSLTEVKRLLVLNKHNLVVEKRYLREVLAHNKKAAKDKYGTVIPNSKVIIQQYKSNVVRRERVVKAFMGLVKTKKPIKYKKTPAMIAYAKAYPKG